MSRWIVLGPLPPTREGGRGDIDRRRRAARSRHPRGEPPPRIDRRSPRKGAGPTRAEPPRRAARARRARCRSPHAGSRPRSGSGPAAPRGRHPTPGASAAPAPRVSRRRARRRTAAPPPPAPSASASAGERNGAAARARLARRARATTAPIWSTSSGPSHSAAAPVIPREAGQGPAGSGLVQGREDRRGEPVCAREAMAVAGPSGRSERRLAAGAGRLRQGRRRARGAGDAHHTAAREEVVQRALVAPETRHDEAHVRECPARRSTR